MRSFEEEKPGKENQYYKKLKNIQKYVREDEIKGIEPLRNAHQILEKLVHEELIINSNLVNYNSTS